MFNAVLTRESQVFADIDEYNGKLPQKEIKRQYILRNLYLFLLKLFLHFKHEANKVK